VKYKDQAALDLVERKLFRYDGFKKQPVVWQ